MSGIIPPTSFTGINPDQNWMMIILSYYINERLLFVVVFERILVFRTHDLNDSVLPFEFKFKFKFIQDNSVTD